MPRILTTKSSVTCPHTGKVAVAGLSRLVVDGGRALHKAGVQTKAVADCVTVADANTDTITCTKVKKVTTGEAAKLTVDGKPVLTTDLAGETNGKVAGVKQPLGLISAGQSRLSTA